MSESLDAALRRRLKRMFHEEPWPSHSIIYQRGERCFMCERIIEAVRPVVDAQLKVAAGAGVGKLGVTPEERRRRGCVYE